ncbi:MAG: ABC transporter permease [Bryobacteraceae bacterium]
MVFLFRRFLLATAQVLAVSCLSFAMFSAAAGDFYSAATAADPRLREGSVNALRRRAGLDRPLPARYAAWLGSVASGEFGESIAYHLPLRALLGPRIRATLRVALPALAAAWVMGLLLAFAAVRFGFGSWEPGAAAVALIPDVVAVSLLLWVAVWAGLPTGTMTLPVVALAFALLPGIFLHAASSLRAAIRLEFVGLARSRGLGGARLWLRYILPAAANPLISLAALTAAGAIGASFLVEVITGWPGLGPFFLDAVQARDYPVVQTVIAGLAALLALCNFAADVLLYRLDPRIRTPHV